MNDLENGNVLTSIACTPSSKWRGVKNTIAKSAEKGQKILNFKRRGLRSGGSALTGPEPEKLEWELKYYIITV